MSEEPWVGIEIQMPGREQVEMPPDRHVIPASALPPLETGTVVSWGDPGSWWAIDAGETTEAPTIHAGQERYRIRTWDNDVVVMPSIRLWVYRPADQAREVTDLAPSSEYAWFDRLVDVDETPPAVLRPRPARELPSLIGAVVWQYHPSHQRWWWWVVVSEPLRVNDDVGVRVVSRKDWSLICAGREPAAEPELVGLNTLWTY